MLHKVISFELAVNFKTEANGYQLYSKHQESTQNKKRPTVNEGVDHQGASTTVSITAPEGSDPPHQEILIKLHNGGAPVSDLMKQQLPSRSKNLYEVAVHEQGRE